MIRIIKGNGLSNIIHKVEVSLERGGIYHNSNNVHNNIIIKKTR